MNHLLAANKENAEKHCLRHVCIFCNKAFSNRQALRSHLMLHQEAARAKNDLNDRHHQVDDDDDSGTSIDLNAPNLSSGDNMSTVFNGSASSSPPSNRVRSENDPRNLNTRFIVSPNLPSGYVNVELNYPQSFPLTAMSPFFLVSNGPFQSCLGIMPFPIAVDYPCPPLFFREPITSGVEEVAEHSKGRNCKRPYLGDAPVNAEIEIVSKRPRIGPKARVGKDRAVKREVNHFKAMLNPSSRVASSSVGDEEKEAALDLSLHL